MFKDIKAEILDIFWELMIYGASFSPKMILKQMKTKVFLNRKMYGINVVAFLYHLGTTGLGSNLYDNPRTIIFQNVTKISAWAFFL
jgi:hypothetical protein